MGKTCRIILIAVLATLFGLCSLLSALGVALLTADGCADLYARTLPSYAKEDLSPILEKETWTEEDYRTLTLQTGLSRTGIDSLPRDRLVSYQDALFYAGKVRHESPSIFTSYDYMTKEDTGVRVRAPIVPLEKGDVLVSTSSHTFGWRHGHSALVTGGAGQVLQCIALGEESNVYAGGDLWFREAGNFMVLRLKDATAEEREEIATRAAKELRHIPYSLTVGIFSEKDQCKDGAPEETHCSHLVWQAFRNAGYDIDANGGGLCQTTDIIASPLFEIVQVYGFDPAQYLV